MEPRTILRCERDQCVARPDRHEEPERSAKKRNDEAFDQKLPDNLSAARANGGANGEFSRTRRSACGEKIGQVRAGDAKDQADCA